LLTAEQKLGLSNETVSNQSIKAGSTYHRFITFKVFVIRKIQRMLGVMGLSISGTINSESLVALIQRLRPVSTPFPLIRIGGSADGGYLVPDDLDKLGACFSPGVAESATFEMGMAERSIPSFLIDYSVDGPPAENKLFRFEKLFLATHTDGTKFIRLEDWVNINAPGDSELILQMDVEGAEWSVLLDTPEQLLARFRIMVIEFHILEKMMTSSLGVEVLSAIIDKISRNFKVVHLHANNAGGVHKFKGQTIPRVLELTFLRKDRFDLSRDRFPPSVPNPLDERNDPTKRDIILSRAWLARD
jgi:hypothetical protein